MSLLLRAAVPLAAATPLLSQPGPSSDEYLLSLDPKGSVVLDAYWEPVTEWVMATPPVPDTPQLLGVTPAEPRREVDASFLEPFLPDRAVSVGEVWEVDDDAIVPLLRQFHPGALSSLHHAPAAIPGTWAVLRAVNERYAEILTRSHAEFLFDPDIYYTPGQFEGRLVLDRRSGAVVSYRLHVPQRLSNVDVNVPTDETRAMGNNLGMPGIGRIPRMELVSAPADAIEWDATVPDEAARRSLREKYYGAIDWLPFDEAIEVAAENGKPLHIVVLLGTLDDESC